MPAAVLAAVALSPASLNAMSVTPVVVDLQSAGRQMTQLVTIENTYARPIILEMKVQEAQYTDDGIKGTAKDTDDLRNVPRRLTVIVGRT